MSNRNDVERLPVNQQAVRCIDCDDDTLVAVGRRFKNLDYLFINSNSKISDQGIAALSKLPRLRQIVVSNGSMLTDASIPALKQLSSLRELSLHGPTEISDNGFISLSENSNLKLLHLLNLPGIRADTIQKIREYLPDCDFRTQ